MIYRDTYFRIRAWDYIVDPAGLTSWTSESAERAFIAETRALFQKAGWTLHSENDSSVCDTVTKGKQELYLHPMYFSGPVLEAEVQPLRELMETTSTFHCYHVDFYEEYLDVSDQEYLTLLESKQPEITDTILKYCKAKRTNLYLTGPVAMDIAGRVAPRRIGDKGTPNKTAVQFIGGLISQMVRQGQLVTADTDHGLGIRTATEGERRARGLLSEEQSSKNTGNMMIQGW
nr:hypothetical protein [uncultured Oscillibacter sp.]